ncbi:hypothetical protein F4782DRAFT_535517 [Xylaria castorea]|nr:hypothetical protein F4782DRAFT_535517 [Xylaria castorea]
MDKLSPEIFEHIISLISRRIGKKDIPKRDHRTLPGALATLATVSRRFQRAIERRTFYRLRIKTNDTTLNTEEGCEEADDYFEDHEDIIMFPKICDYSRLTLVPDDEKLNAMIVAFARYYARMPALETANVRFEDNNEDYPYQVVFIAAFYRVSCWDADMANTADSCRIYLHVKDWRPTNATIAELNDVGVERYGQPSTIGYLEWGDYY